MKTAALASLLLSGMAATAAAQEAVEPRVSAEAVVSASMLSSNAHVAGMVDVTSTLRLGGGATLIARPWAWRRPDGTSTFQWYQLQLRYQSGGRTPIRIDAGVITSPIGLSTLQMRADLNPTISPVTYYVIPLPRFERTAESLQPLTAGYPVGAIVSTSSTHWDLRGGVLDTTPARNGVALKEDPYPSLPQAVVGGGLTLRPGLRIGAAVAHGGYRKADVGVSEGTASVANVEGEYTIDHTRLSGEWVVDRFHGATGVVRAKSFYLQGVQTITPRIFAAARLVRVRTPPVFGLGLATEWSAAELTGGLRVTPHVTVRAGYYGQRPYFRDDWTHAAAGSIVLDGRWWR